MIGAHKKYSIRITRRNIGFYAEGESSLRIPCTLETFSRKQVGFGKHGLQNPVLTNRNLDVTKRQQWNCHIYHEQIGKDKSKSENVRWREKCIPTILSGSINLISALLFFTANDIVS